MESEKKDEIILTEEEKRRFDKIKKTLSLDENSEEEYLKKAVRFETLQEEFLERLKIVQAQEESILSDEKYHEMFKFSRFAYVKSARIMGDDIATIIIGNKTDAMKCVANIMKEME